MGSNSQITYEKVVHEQPWQESINGSKSTISFEAAYERELEYQRSMKMKSMNPPVDCSTLSASPVSLKPLKSILSPRKRQASSPYPQEAHPTIHHQKQPPQNLDVQQALASLQNPEIVDPDAYPSNEMTASPLEQQPLKPTLPPMKRKAPSPSNPQQLLQTTHNQKLPSQQLQIEDSPPYEQNHHKEHLDAWCNLCEVPCSSLEKHREGSKHNAKLGEVLDKKNGDSDKKQHLWCKQYNIGCTDKSSLARHPLGEKHVAPVLELKKENPKPDPVGTEHQTTPLWCNVCNIPCLNKLNFQQHIHGKKYKAKAEEVLHNTNRGTYKNQVFQCHDCNIWCQDKLALAQHEMGKKHAARLLELKNPKSNPVGTEHQTTPLSCSICNIPCMNELNFQQHLDGKKHKAKAEEVLHKMNSGADKNQVFQCHDCNIWCQDQFALAQHEIGKKHVARLQELKGCNSEEFFMKQNG